MRWILVKVFTVSLSIFSKAAPRRLLPFLVEKRYVFKRKFILFHQGTGGNWRFFLKKKLSIFKLKSDHETYFFVKPPSLRRRSLMQRKCAASILPQYGSTTPIYVLVNSDNVSSKKLRGKYFHRNTQSKPHGYLYTSPDRNQDTGQVQEAGVSSRTKGSGSQSQQEQGDQIENNGR